MSRPTLPARPPTRTAKGDSGPTSSARADEFGTCRVGQKSFDHHLASLSVARRGFGISLEGQPRERSASIKNEALSPPGGSVGIGPPIRLEVARFVGPGLADSTPRRMRRYTSPRSTSSRRAPAGTVTFTSVLAITPCASWGIEWCPAAWSADHRLRPGRRPPAPPHRSRSPTPGPPIRPGPPPRRAPPLTGQRSQAGRASGDAGRARRRRGGRRAAVPGRLTAARSHRAGPMPRGSGPGGRPD